jgi:small subunit ribosomal protein S20
MRIAALLQLVGKFMANIKSAKKRILQIERRSAINRSRRSDMRTHVKLVEKAIEAGEAIAAKAAFEIAQPRLMRSAQKGLLHRNTASRKLSRLSKQIKSLSA